MKNLILLITFLFSSCASNDLYFDKSYFVSTAESEGSKLSYQDLHERLTRRTSMAGGLYQISVTPLTDPLLEAQAKDQGDWKNLSPEEIATETTILKKQYTDGKSCVEFNAQILRFEGASKTPDWKISLFTDLVAVREGELEVQEQNAKEFEMNWITPTPPVVKSQVVKIQDTYDQWLLSGISCTYRALPLESGFAVKIIAPFINFPFSEMARLDYGNWGLYDDDKLKGDDKDQEAPAFSSKVKTQSSQRYRGW